MICAWELLKNKTFSRWWTSMSILSLFLFLFPFDFKFHVILRISGEDLWSCNGWYSWWWLMQIVMIQFYYTSLVDSQYMSNTIAVVITLICRIFSRGFCLAPHVPHSIHHIWDFLGSCSFLITIITQEM